MFAAEDEDTPLTEWALKMEVSTPAASAVLRLVLLACVSERT